MGDVVEVDAVLAKSKSDELLLLVFLPLLFFGGVSDPFGLAGWIDDFNIVFELDLNRSKPCGGFLVVRFSLHFADKAPEEIC